MLDMNSLKKIDMFSFGYVTVFLYIASITFLFLGVFYPQFLAAGIILGGIFFIIPSIIIAWMMGKRINS